MKGREFLKRFFSSRATAMFFKDDGSIAPCQQQLDNSAFYPVTVIALFYLVSPPTWSAIFFFVSIPQEWVSVLNSLLAG